MITGTLLVQAPHQTEWVSALPDIPLKPGSMVRTDQLSQAFVVLFDYSTLQIYPGTEIEVTEMATSRFGPRRDTIQLSLHQGKVHIGVAPELGAAKSMRIATPHGSFDLDEGSYTFEVGQDRTQLRVGERGRAEAESEGSSFALHAGERIDLGPGLRPNPTFAREELLTNGNFAEGFKGWHSGESPGFPDGADVQAQQALTIDEGRVAVRFQRGGSHNTHDETYLYQQIDRDVSAFSELYFSLDLKINHQSLSGGGYLGNEYPVIVRLTYRTASGDTVAGFGFYYQNTARNRTDFGIEIPGDTWVSYTTPMNLMNLTPRPLRILSIQVAASGWDFDSQVANIKLQGR